MLQNKSENDITESQPLVMFSTNILFFKIVLDVSRHKTLCEKDVV